MNYCTAGCQPIRHLVYAALDLPGMPLALPNWALVLPSLVYTCACRVSLRSQISSLEVRHDFWLCPWAYDMAMQLASINCEIVLWHLHNKLLSLQCCRYM